jgi:Protein of unknown function (DUF2971)
LISVLIVIDMRAYKFLSQEYGLKSLQKKRLKLSRLNDLNDPFELVPYDLTDPKIRKAAVDTKEQLGNDRGILCLSLHWRNPVIWAHYADKHKGLCLGFEVSDINNDVVESEASLVTYVGNKLSFPTDFSTMPDEERYQFVRNVLFTKFEPWAYEEEVRLWASLENEEEGLYFMNFQQSLQLVEVIVGARCGLTLSEIRTLGQVSDEVAIRKARAAYDQFQMTEDEDWNN